MLSLSASPVEPDLSVCDREPISRLDLIQPFGFLLALSKDWLIARASANVQAFLGAPPEAVIGSKLTSWLNDRAMHDIRNRLALLPSTGSERLYGVKLLKAGEAAFDLALHFAGDLLILAGEPSQTDEGMEAASMVRALIERLKRVNTLDAMHREAARHVGAITKFDRVMIYRFDETGAGEVIADSVGPGVESFLGLHYPASDIPVQARALYLRNPFRIIADVSSPAVSIDPPTPGPAAALDLSMAITRAVSPVHIEYLTNMGVGASLSISIIVEGALWGLIACHHRSARLPSFVMRTAAELFGQMYAMMLESRLHHHAAEEERRTRQIADRLITAIAADDGLLADARWLHAISREIIDSDGVAICRAGEVAINGATPSEADVRLLAKTMTTTTPSRVFATDHLASLAAGCEVTADQAAGVLAIPISRTPGDYIMLFRRERNHERKWGGEPGKAWVPSEDGLRLSPRKSFAAYAEVVRGRAIPFSERDLRVGEAIRLAMIEVILRLSESASDERKAASQRQELLIAELNHRVRNILSLIRGLITQTARSATDVSLYVDGLNSRVQSLARAHDQITRQNWGPGSISALFDDEIAAHCPDGAGRFVLEGPALLLQPTAITTLALVIHELVTNSVKHGALSAAGTVKVTAEIEEGNGVWLRWRERGGPAVRAPLRRGFGSVIVERSVPFDLQGLADVRFALAGFEADFFIPIQHVWLAPLPTTHGVHDLLAPPPQVVQAGSDEDTPLAGRRVLLVEDSMLIALEAEDMLMALGATTVTVASTLGGAANALAGAAFDLAVLDISVGQGTSFEFASRLKQLGTPYIFASGYGDQVALDAEHGLSVVVQKPYSRDHLRVAVRKVLRPAGPSWRATGALAAIGS